MACVKPSLGLDSPCPCLLRRRLCHTCSAVSRHTCRGLAGHCLCLLSGICVQPSTSGAVAPGSPGLAGPHTFSSASAGAGTLSGGDDLLLCTPHAHPDAAVATACRGRITAWAKNSRERHTCAWVRLPKLQTSSSVSTPMASRCATCAATCSGAPINTLPMAVSSS